MMTRRPLLLIAAACLLVPATARPVLPHGTPFQVGYDQQANRVTVTPDVYRVFDLEELFALDEFGLVTNDGTPGWDRAASLPRGTRLSLRIAAPLQYWAAAGADDPLPMPGGGIGILAAGGMATVAAAGWNNPTAVDGVQPLFVASFTSHHHVVWEILDPDPPGLYGVWATLESADPSVFAAAPSPPFLVVLNHGVTDPAIYDRGVDRLDLARGGRLDVGFGRFDISAGGIDPPALLGHLRSGRNQGGWNGASGIVSSGVTPGSPWSVGVVFRDDGSALASWAALGDADLDGAVTTADVNAMLTGGLLNTGMAGATWQQGDFDYDGLVTTADINALLTAGLLNKGSYRPTAVATVPEPGWSLPMLPGILVVVSHLLRRGGGFRLRG
jgi:hypothetical protein